MKPILVNALKDKVAWFFGTLLFILISTLGYTYILSLHNPIRIENNPTEPIQVQAGKSFQICRKVIYNRDVSVTLSRAITTGDKNGIHTISYPSINIIRKKGISTICRYIMLPNEIEDGIWNVHTYITIHTPPFWKADFEVQQFQIEVSE